MTKMNRCLLCTDMDRTLIPNGVQAEHPEAREIFRTFCQSPEVTLAYVTGRHLSLVEDAIQEYQLPEPHFAITDVGTKIFQALPNGQWQAMSAWETHIAEDWLNRTHAELLSLLKPVFDTHPTLRLQEDSKQNTHKISFYLPMAINPAPIINQAEAILTQSGIQASLIWSLDEANHVGLLDILPKHATKLHAIEFLQNQQNFALNEVVFAGDSGNDLPVLISDIPAVLVANASPEIQRQAQHLAELNQHTSALYLAKNLPPSNHNGHYAAGILQGVAHFMPTFPPAIRAMQALTQPDTTAYPKRVAIFGEVLFDCFEDGQRVLGGAPFNIAWHLQAFGDEPLFISAVGQDALGKEILNACLQWGLNTDHIQLHADQATGQVAVKLIENEPDYEITYPVAYDFIQAETPLDPQTLLYHGSLALRNPISRQSFESLAKTPGIDLFCDVNLRSPWWNRVEVFKLLHQATWVKLNLDELQQLGFQTENLETTMQDFVAQFKLKQLIVTRGTLGTIVLDENGDFFSHTPPPISQFVDTVGAGDAFTSVYIHGLLSNWTIPQTLVIAQAFASQIIGLQGATTQDRQFYQSFKNQNF